MFKFNFGNTSEDTEEGKPESTVSWYNCQQVKIMSNMREKLKNIENNVIDLRYEGNLTLSCLSPSGVIARLKKDPENPLSDILEADNYHSDLIPGKYEGGLKIWECTTDLVNYLMQNGCGSFSDKRVLDLGCGAGILGIVALLKGAFVTFQDYNYEVLELTTIPNVFLNLKTMDVFEKAEFFSGDWGSFLNVISQYDSKVEKETEQPLKKLKVAHNLKYDYILSSETIYNSDNYGKIYQIMKELMKESGTCYIAAKKCYFGVGGNIKSFVDYITRENIFHVQTCCSLDEGVAREVLQITFRK